MSKSGDEPSAELLQFEAWLTVGGLLLKTMAPHMDCVGWVSAAIGQCLQLAQSAGPASMPAMLVARRGAWLCGKAAGLGKYRYISRGIACCQLLK